MVSRKRAWALTFFSFILFPSMVSYCDYVRMLDCIETQTNATTGIHKTRSILSKLFMAMELS